jgi:PhnB protein
MPTINPYLVFNGNCEKAFNFYKSVFGGEFTYIGRFKDMPEEYKSPEGDENLIMHVSLPIGNETILMGSDTSVSHGQVTFGSNFSISISTDSKEDADRLFNGLSAGGKIIMPMADAFWGSYFGMFTDKFGVNWMVGYEQSEQNQS